MAIDIWSGTYEASLLRIIAGQLNVLLQLQFAPVLFGKPLNKLTDDELNQLIAYSMHKILEFANWATPGNLGMPPGGLPPSGKAH